MTRCTTTATGRPGVTRYTTPRPTTPARVPLTSIRTAKHPLSMRQYSRLYDDLEASANRFRDLGHPEIAEEMTAAVGALWRAWSLVQETERAEYAAHGEPA